MTEVLAEMDNLAEGLGDALKTGDIDDFKIAASDITDKREFIDLLRSHEMEIELIE